MSAPVIRDFVNHLQGQSVANFPVNVPTHEPGDLMIAIVSNGNLFNRNISPPAGWSALIEDDEHTLASQQWSFSVWYRIAGESEGSTYTFTRNSQYTDVRVVILAISGAADPSVRPIVFARDATTPDPALQPVAPSVNATHADSLVLRYATQRSAPWQSNAWTMPVGHEGVLQVASNWGCALVRATANVGATGTATFTHTDYGQSNAYWRCTLAIAPAAEPEPGGTPLPVFIHHYQQQQGL